MVTSPYNRNCGGRCRRVHGVSGEVCWGVGGAVGRGMGNVGGGVKEVCWGVGGGKERCVGKCTGIR